MSPEDRILTLSRDVYADQLARHGRAQQIALGMLAFNGAFMAALAAGVWQASSEPGVVPLACLWLLAAGAVLSLVAAGVHVYVAARGTMAWPDAGLVCDRYVAEPAVGDALFLARLYARAVFSNEPFLSSQFRFIAVANIVTGCALIMAYAALAQLIV